MSETRVASQLSGGEASEDLGRWWAGGMGAVVAIAALRLLILLLAANRYGYFGDELYFLDCGRHLDWGYVDQPPLIAVTAWALRHTLGTSLFALHLLPALCGAATVVLTGVIARQLGARAFGLVLAATSVMAAVVYWILNHLFTMNMFEPLLWMGCASLVIRIIQSGKQKLWLWFGLLSGIGLENKYSMAIFGFGMVAGLLLTRERRAFAHRWIWIGGVIALLVFLPNLIWNVRHHWPFLELMRNIRASGRDVQMGPLRYLLSQVLMLTPFTLPVWLTGLLYFFLSPRGRRYAVLGWAYVVTLVAMIVFHGKDYYLGPAYPMLFAAGAVAIEDAFQRWSLGWARPVSVAILAITFLPLLPVALPVLPVETYVWYQSKLPLALPVSEKAHARALLPHHFAWNFGWEEMVGKVAEVYNRLPAQERAETAILAGNFAEAGAIDLMGKKYGLPDAISGHQSYWLWGPRQYTGHTVIIIGSRPEREREHFDQVTVAATLDNPYGAVWERRPILLCRQNRWTLAQMWPKIKDWD